MAKTLIKLNNFTTRRLRHGRFEPREVLLLFSSCLQCSSCDCNLASSLDNCRRCGRCVVGRLLELAEELGVVPFMATGGRLAARKARDPTIKAVVAVACCKELTEGIKATFPKPVLAMELSTPNGPCKDTCVDFDSIRDAVKHFLK